MADTFKRVLEVPLEGAGSILVEVDQEIERPVTRSWRPKTDVATTAETLDSALEPLEPASRAILARLRGGPDPPREITVEFGIKLNAEAGMIIARTSAEANFRVELKWARDS